MGHRDFARELSRREQIETTGTTSEYVYREVEFACYAEIHAAAGPARNIQTAKLSARVCV